MFEEHIRKVGDFVREIRKGKIATDVHKVLVRNYCIQPDLKILSRHVFSMAESHGRNPHELAVSYIAFRIGFMDRANQRDFNDALHFIRIAKSAYEVGTAVDHWALNQLKIQAKKTLGVDISTLKSTDNLDPREDSELKFSVQLNRENSNYEITQSKSRINGYEVIFTGTENDCLNLVSYARAGVELEKNPILVKHRAGVKESAHRTQEKTNNSKTNIEGLFEKEAATVKLKIIDSVEKKIAEVKSRYPQATLVSGLMNKADYREKSITLFVEYRDSRLRLLEDNPDLYLEVDKNMADNLAMLSHRCGLN